VYDTGSIKIGGLTISSDGKTSKLGDNIEVNEEGTFISDVFEKDTEAFAENKAIILPSVPDGYHKAYDIAHVALTRTEVKAYLRTTTPIELYYIGSDGAISYVSMDSSTLAYFALPNGITRVVYMGKNNDVPTWGVFHLGGETLSVSTTSLE